MAKSRRVIALVAALVLFLTSTPGNDRLVYSAPERSAAEDAHESSWDEQHLKTTADALCKEFNAFLKEIGSEPTARVKVSERYIFVYNVSDVYLEWISVLLEEVAKAFDKFVDKIGLEVDELTEPMTVVVFATREEFDAYAAVLRGPDYMNLKRTVSGFYHHRLNRSIVYDHTGVEAFRSDNVASTTENRSYSRKRINLEAREVKLRKNAESNIRTLVHETTHQLCFNYGVFSTAFRVPDWVVEGMAATFEPATPEAPLGWRFRNVFPVSRHYLNALRKYAQEYASSSAIVRKALVTDVLDEQGYAASWAIFYYCYRKRPKELAAYLKLIASKRPFAEYPEEEKINDFVEFFGDISEFSAELEKYMKKL